MTEEAEVSEESWGRVRRGEIEFEQRYVNLSNVIENLGQRRAQKKGSENYATVALW